MAISFNSCSKDGEPDASVSVAVKQWIAGNYSETNCQCEPYAEKYQWRGQAVYVFLTAGPACLSMPLYYDETGTKITMDANFTYAQFAGEAKLIKRVWACKESYL